MRIVKLHNWPILMDDCCSLLNQEWPRSKTARIHSLSKSSDYFPMCLCLIDDGDNNSIIKLETNSNGDPLDKPIGQLIGHVKVSRGSLEGEAYIESLIICKSRRGQGLGSQFMVSIEQFIKSIGFTSITLHTIDASNFYSKLGYSLITTIEALGPASVNIIAGETKTQSKFNQNTNQLIVTNHQQGTSSKLSIDCPLPPPPPSNPITNRPVIKQEKIVMNKRLT
ncbi:N-alpha-acetyltransferase 80-like [Panonychus citri]|uniref:N-alpha-acetyltransferase 80-like n=1 Tax=Panonychus citri TaxID=50023 RepID=UPI002307370F|nr:N-alpha-acetyltransferase 80-like [Panonychus citri]